MYESFGIEEVAVTVSSPDHRDPKLPHVIQSQFQDGPVTGKRCTHQWFWQHPCANTSKKVIKNLNSSYERSGKMWEACRNQQGTEPRRCRRKGREVLKQRFPLIPWSPWWSRLCPCSPRGSVPEQSAARRAFLAEAAAANGEELTPDQVCWQDLWARGTHAGAAWSWGTAPCGKDLCWMEKIIKGVRMKKRQRWSHVDWPQLPFPILLCHTGGGDRRVGGKLSPRRKEEWEEGGFSFVSASYYPTLLLPMIVIGKWSACPSLHPWAFPLYFLLLSCCGGERWGIWKHQGEPTTLYLNNSHNLSVTLNFTKCILLSVCFQRQKCPEKNVL